MDSPLNALAWAHPIVRDWFLERFGSPTEPQELGWPHILSGSDTLICAPTGSGKTLAAFLACLDRLVRKALAGELQDRTQVLYVSPLKALGNDIQKNLESPLGEIVQMAANRGLLMPPIRTAVRTGDTLMHERRAMLKRPPHILVTTPESLYILLTAEKSRALLKDVETVIVDEIHAVADDKRGSHLALSLERLETLAMQSQTPGKRRPPRIGLSATQKPLELVARFLVGSGRPEPAVVNIGRRRQPDLAVEVPAGELGPVASNEMWDDVYNRIADLARQHRSTLVFVNTRRLAERVAHQLSARLGEETVAAHHGSLSRKLRLAAERKLKSGEARVLVATASLELGIDIGTVDLVCQVGSPRSISVALQRIGRAGHWRGAIPKGRLFAMTRDDLLECTALVRAIRRGELDRIAIPEESLDVLAQQIVAMCAAEECKEEDLYRTVCRAYPYRDLSRAEFEEIIHMLSEGVSTSRGHTSSYLHRDRVNGRVRGRRGSRLAAIMNGGAIPENALYTVVAMPEGNIVGTVDEDFAVESLRGDIMLLGNNSWRIRRVEPANGRVLVEDSHGAPPNVPFWRGEAPARTAELSLEVAELRQKIAQLLSGAEASLQEGAESGRQELAKRSQNSRAVAWLQNECGLDESGATQATDYILSGQTILGAVPTLTTLVAERFFDEAGDMQLVIHAPFGGRINRAWGLALRKRFCRSFNFELQAAATDNGLCISLREQHSFPLSDVFHFLHGESVKAVLEQAALASPMFTTRFRWDATRALALLRFRRGKKIPLQIQRMSAEDLLASVFPDAAACQENIVGDIRIPNHPLVRETMKDVLTEAMDLDGLKRVLSGISDGSIRCVAVDTSAPSVFAHEILSANPYAYLDDAPLEERRARAVAMRRTLPEDVLGEAGRLDPAAIEQVRREAWPDVRDADELADVLQALIALPESFVSPAGEPVAAAWASYFQQLVAERRAARAVSDDAVSWVAAEKAKTFSALFTHATIETKMAEVEELVPTREDALVTMARGWLAHSGPLTGSSLANILHILEGDVQDALLHLETAGSVLRGRFVGGSETEWCDRRLLARIHRLTLGKLRKQIEPVTPVQFMRWLLRWQHVAPGAQVTGERGLLEVVRQLQGFEAPATAWEPQILSRRVSGYDPKALDQLCLTGAIGWGRLSPHPATLNQGGGEEATGKASQRRVVPSSIAPVTFFVREEADWMLSHRGATGENVPGLSNSALLVLDFLRLRGASFFADIVRGTGRLKSEVETALWELVAAGLSTADGFDNLRALIDPKRRAGEGRGRSSRPRHSTGRWSLLLREEPVDRTRAVEAIAQVLLRRYGVVFREVVARESFPAKWREVLIALRRLEDRGEVHGGRFVDGFLGEQFALPFAVESLRALRKIEPSGEKIVVSTADPLNLLGILLSGERVAANSGRLIALRDGLPIAEEANLPRAAAGF